MTKVFSHCFRIHCTVRLAFAVSVAACAVSSADEQAQRPSFEWRGSEAAASPVLQDTNSSGFAARQDAPASRKKAPALYNSVRTARPVVALTFDDGPHATLTPKLLDILARERVHATFFVLGTNVSLYPDIAKRIVAEGHEIANHSWNHPSLPKVGAERLDRELRRTTEIIEQTTGQKVTMMRPTYGALNDRVQKSLLNDYKLDVILWSVDPRDWKRPGPSVVARRLVSGAHPGAILLVHDIHPGTIAAMPETIAGLKAKGYGFATMSELLAMDDPSLATTNAPAPVEVLPEGAGYR